MAKLTKAQQTAKRIERLEQTKLILEEKLKTLQAGLLKVNDELDALKKK